MTPGVRVRVLVGAVALVAAGTVVGVVLATRQTPPQPRAQCKQAPKAVVVTGVRSAEVAAVRRALAARDLPALEVLARDHPADPVVQFNFATLLYCRGYLADASGAYRRAKAVGRDTYYEVASDNILHPQYFTPTDGPGYPIFERTTNDPLLVRGVVLQREFHQHSAERLYERAARLHPDDPDSQVAAAVGRFDESNLSASFSRLGPLVRRFPSSQTVRYHLGLLLAWTGQRALAVKEFTAARKLGPATALGREAAAFLKGLSAGGTTTPGS